MLNLRRALHTLMVLHALKHKNADYISFSDLACWFEHMSFVMYFPAPSSLPEDSSFN